MGAALTARRPLVGVRALPVGGVDDADWEACPPTREDQGDTTSGESVENSLTFFTVGTLIVWERGGFFFLPSFFPFRLASSASFSLIRSSQNFRATGPRPSQSKQARPAAGSHRAPL